MATSASSTPFPSSPNRDTPNAHPYAIKTSSSAVLTRSNSTGHRYNINHHYSPVSPPKNALAAKQSRYMQAHRHTKSLSAADEESDVKLPSMPVPPSSSVPARLANQLYVNGGQVIVSDGENIPPTPPMTVRIKRSDTLPSVLPSKSESEVNVEDLPKNPKAWTPKQLSAYLSSSLRLKGGVKLPVPVARDIASFVVNEHLSGRAFLRMKKEDYDHLGINQLWKDALLDASRALRQNLVQGRIMGFGSGSPLSPRSAEEMVLALEEEEAPSPSAELPAYSTLDPGHRRVPQQWAEDKKRMSKTSFRAGRVRGMVETYERSFSGSSASGSDDEDKAAGFKLDARELVCEPEEDEGGFASGELTSASEDEAYHPMASGSHLDSSPDVGLVASPTSGSGDPFAPPLPHGVAHPAISEDSPSIEALLHEQEQSGLEGKQYQSWGAKAWEDELDDPTGVHATARRVPIGTAHKVVASEPYNTTVRVSPSSTVQSAPKGLAELFTQPEVEERPAPKIMKDASVGIEEVKKEVEPRAVYETLELFKRRLEVVEKRLDEMERKDRERDEALEREAAEVERLCRASEDVRRASEHRGAIARRYLPRAFDILYPGERKDKVKNYSGGDPSVTGLPRYVFLISLGVVAIVTRVMLRRMFGGRKRT